MLVSIESILRQLDLVSGRVITSSQKPDTQLGLQGLEYAYVGLLLHQKFPGDHPLSLNAASKSLRDGLQRAYTFFPKDGTDLKNKTGEQLIQKLETDVAALLHDVQISPRESIVR